MMAGGAELFFAEVPVASGGGKFPFEFALELAPDCGGEFVCALDADLACCAIFVNTLDDAFDSALDVDCCAVLPFCDVTLPSRLSKSCLAETEFAEPLVGGNSMVMGDGRAWPLGPAAMSCDTACGNAFAACVGV